MTDELPDFALPGTSPQIGQGEPIAVCGRCHRRHLPQLKCWRGRYAARVGEQVFRERGRLCWQCRRENRRTVATAVDHIMPRSLGGTDELRNLEPSCVRHNSGKGNRVTSPYPDADGIGGNGQPVSERFR